MNWLLLSRRLRSVPALLALPLLLLAIWEAAAHYGKIPAYILPSPGLIWIALVDNRGLLFGVHLPATLKEAGIGLLLSLFVGTLLGLGMYLSRTLEKALYPLIVVSQTIPLIALSPIFILWFGYSLTGKVAVVFLTAFFPIVTGTFDGLKQENAGYKELLATMGASAWTILQKVGIPLALPSFFSGLRLASVYSVIGATIGEWLGGSEGLGYFSRRMAGNLQSDAMFASVLLLAALGVALFLAVTAIEHIILTRRGASK